MAAKRSAGILSGRQQDFAEIDRAAWFARPKARVKILPGLVYFLTQLEAALGRR